MVRRLLEVVIFGLAVVATARGQSGLNVAELISDPARLVFQEDFTDAHSLDRFVFSSPDHWRRIKVGERWALEHTDAGAAYQPRYRSPLNIALIATQRCGSFVLDYEVQQTGHEYGHRDACVFFNFVEPTHFYYAHVATQSDAHAHQIFTVNDAPRSKITEIGTAGFDWGAEDRWHRVRLVRDLQSGSIDLFVDQLDKPIMRANDKSHGPGFVGFGSFDDSGRVTNVRLYSADSKDGRPGFFKGK